MSGRGQNKNKSSASSSTRASISSAPSPTDMAYKSVKGSKHERNEDSVFVDYHNKVIAVFDGMGGPGSGEQASQAACERLEELIKEKPDNDDMVANYRWLQDTLQPLDRAVREAVFPNRSAGTTGIIAAIVEGEPNSVFVANVGDSRCYRYSKKTNSLEQLSEDDSSHSKEVGDLLDSANSIEDISGNIAAAEAFQHRNFIINCFGQLNSNVLHVNNHNLEKDDVIFVCSDGVHDNLTKQEIEAIVSKNNDTPEQISEALIEASTTRMSDGTFRSKDDDVSIAIIQNN